MHKNRLRILVLHRARLFLGYQARSRKISGADVLIASALQRQPAVTLLRQQERKVGAQLQNDKQGLAPCKTSARNVSEVRIPVVLQRLQSSEADPRMPGQSAPQVLR